MASFGQLTNAFFKATQETTVGLANLNFDFAIIKYDAPKEYQGLGEALSKRRREAAEDGPLHITARKLGALFQSAMPKVPNLIRAYGLRASEIAKSPEANPQSSARHGIFADHVGPDGATIWAAATSGAECVRVHLLACMLARIWGREEAVSIWSELVESRKRLLEQEVMGSEGGFNVSDLAASRIDITRSQLDAWDASARAWLQTADAAKMLQQTQFRLLVDNTSLPIPYDGSLYTTTMDALTKALQALDNLVKGAPQQIDHGAVLLGLSAWHLYPDILMANTNTYVAQADALINSGGIITIGLENKDQTGSGVSWSMPLAQTKYYGDPILAKRHLGVGESRVSFDGFLLVVIGSIIRGWQDPTLDLDQQVNFILKLSAAARASTGRVTGDVYPYGGLWYANDPSRLDWLTCLEGAASQYIGSTGVSRTHMNRLISFGRRRCKNLVAYHLNFFGLVDFRVLLASLEGDEGRVRLLRNWARRELDSESICNAVIAYQPGGQSRIRYTRIGFEAGDSFEDHDTVKVSGDTEMIPPGPGEKPALHDFLYGDPKYAAIYVPATERRVRPKNIMTIPQFFRCLEEGDFPATCIETALGIMCKSSPSYAESLRAVGLAAKIYSRLQGARVHLQVASRPLVDLHWWRHFRELLVVAHLRKLPAIFSCIAYFETGVIDANPDSIAADQVFAVSFENSIFVAESLLRDPAEETPKGAIERLVGNIGRPGVAFLITPPRPKIRKIDYSSWHMVSHDPFDGVAEDNFQGTSVHLSFTGYEFPVDLGYHGNHETPACFLETVISAYDCGKWVADLELLRSSRRWLHLLDSHCAHSPGERDEQLRRLNGVSVDSWLELLDPPTQGAAVVRAHGNPVARLAAAALALRQTDSVYVIRGHPCWACASSRVKLGLERDQWTRKPQTQPRVSGDTDSEEGHDEGERVTLYDLPEGCQNEEPMYAFNMLDGHRSDQHRAEAEGERVFFIY